MKFDKGLKAKQGRWATELEATHGEDEFVTQVRAIAWGDFDGDGIDDVVVAVVNSDPDSAYAEHRLLLMTRRSGDHLLETVKAAGP